MTEPSYERWRCLATVDVDTAPQAMDEILALIPKEGKLRDLADSPEGMHRIEFLLDPKIPEEQASSVGASLVRTLRDLPSVTIVETAHWVSLHEPCARVDHSA